jgi:hypothetical protein
MGLLRALSDGTMGVRLKVPSHLTAISDTDSLQLADTSRQLTWKLFFFPSLHLEIAEDPALREAFSLHARKIFEDMFRISHPNDGAEPRTKDPNWTPLIDVNRAVVDGGQALVTVHRMAYEPRSEVVMGHFLIPLRDGLFEARVLGSGQLPATGTRETILMFQYASGNAPAPLPQATYDDPQHDQQFPTHPLSQVRTELATFPSDWALKILAPPQQRDAGSIHLSAQCRITPPSRYFLSESDETTATFKRVSFCGTDGIDVFFLARGAEASSAPLMNQARKLARALHAQDGVREVRLDESPCEAIDGRPQVQVIVHGVGRRPIRNVMRFFVDENGSLWSLNSICGLAVPVRIQAAELEQVAHSFQVVERPTLWTRLFKR